MEMWYTKTNPSGYIAIENGKIVSFDTWHKINGKWVNICQIFKEEKTEYYTDGKLEE